jgi:ectoine hydroxylase-related dioxygenase (phytanoyl-CoA dioxygenase family)
VTDQSVSAARLAARSDLLGYVVVKNVLSEDQVRIGNEAIDMLEQQGDLTVTCPSFLHTDPSHSPA